jgi:hypothetical protein
VRVSEEERRKLFAPQVSSLHYTFLCSAFATRDLREFVGEKETEETSPLSLSTSERGSESQARIAKANY